MIAIVLCVFSTWFHGHFVVFYLRNLEKHVNSLVHGSDIVLWTIS